MFCIGLQYLPEDALCSLSKSVAEMRHFSLNFSTKKARLKMLFSKYNMLCILSQEYKMTLIIF